MFNGLESPYSGLLARLWASMWSVPRFIQACGQRLKQVSRELSIYHHASGEVRRAALPRRQWLRARKSCIVICCFASNLLQPVRIKSERVVKRVRKIFQMAEERSVLDGRCDADCGSWRLCQPQYLGDVSHGECALLSDNFILTCLERFCG